MHPSPVLLIHPGRLSSHSLFLCMVGSVLLVCILLYLKHFINPRMGNFLRRDFQVL